MRRRESSSLDPADQPGCGERILSLICSVLLLPLFVGIATAVLFTSGSPVLVREKVSRGRHVLRFRTHVRASSGRQYPTRLGIFLAYHNLRTLPQLLDVVMGRSRLRELI